MDPVQVVTLLEALSGVAKEVVTLIAAKNAGVPQDIIIAAIEKLMDEQSASKMRAEFPNG